MKEILRLESINVSTLINKIILLEGISFTVEEGDFLGIIGASGAGKSTLLRLLNRLINPSLGTIYFKGENINNISPITLRRQIVLVPQEPKLLGMTVQQTLTYPLELLKLNDTEIKSRLSFWLDKLQIPEEWLERNELQLSLGQKQFVAIARGLILQPKILLLDEPTSALDYAKANFLLQILKELTNSNKTTIMMVNHQLEWGQKFANRVIYLERGHLLKNQLIDEINWEKVKDDLLKNQINQNADDF